MIGQNIFLYQEKTQLNSVILNTDEQLINCIVYNECLLLLTEYGNVFWCKIGGKCLRKLHINCEDLELHLRDIIIIDKKVFILSNERIFAQLNLKCFYDDLYKGYLVFQKIEWCQIHSHCKNCTEESGLDFLKIVQTSKHILLLTLKRIYLYKDSCLEALSFLEDLPNCYIKVCTSHLNGNIFIIYECQNGENFLNNSILEPAINFQKFDWEDSFNEKFSSSVNLYHQLISKKCIQNIEISSLKEKNDISNEKVICNKNSLTIWNSILFNEIQTILKTRQTIIPNNLPFPKLNEKNNQKSFYNMLLQLEFLNSDTVEIDNKTCDKFYLKHKRSSSLDLNLVIKNDKSKFQKTSIQNLCSNNLHFIKKINEIFSNESIINVGCQIFKKTNIYLWDNSLHGTFQIIPEFEKLVIIKVSSGKLHTLFLTIDALLYVLGDNTHEQLGKIIPLKQYLFPEVVNLPSGFVISDVTAGNLGTLLLDFKGNLFLLGFGCENLTKIFNLSEYTKELNLCITRVINYEHYFVFSAKETPSHYKIFIPYVEEEKLFMRLLSWIHCNLIPIFLKNIGDLPFKSNLNLLFEILKNFLYAHAQLCINSVDIMKNNKVHELSLIKFFIQLSQLFAEYTSVFCDLISVNCLKSLETIEVKNILKTLDKIIILENASDLLEAIFIFPTTMPRKYCQFLLDVSAEIKNRNNYEYEIIETIGKQWLMLSDFVDEEIKKAYVTKTFWINCPKSLQNLKIPQDRVLAHSRIVPATILNSSRFSFPIIVLLSNQLIYLSIINNSYYPLELVWFDSTSRNIPCEYGICIITPEESWIMAFATNAEKQYWLKTLQMAILFSLKQTCNESHRKLTKNVSSPLIRNAVYKFTKNPYKGSEYNGTWFYGKMNGCGELTWSDGRKQTGNFRQNMLHGYGEEKLIINEGIISYQGYWENGKLNGWGKIIYSTGDVYEGCLSNGVPNGHGMLKQGKVTNSIFYIGNWENGMKENYGVMDNRNAGWWHRDMKHGQGCLVTLDGLYYEGTFIQGKLTEGIVILDDETIYKGEFLDIGVLNGKGSFFYPNGDWIKGTFNGKLGQELKITGVFNKKNNASESDITIGKYWVRTDLRWNTLFIHCCQQLSISWPFAYAEIEKLNEIAWNKIAAILSRYKRGDAVSFLKPNIVKKKIVLDDLEKIPSFGKGMLTCDELRNLLDLLVTAYRSTYIYCGSHPRLLFQAVEELKAITQNIYQIVCVLFPKLCFAGAENSFTLSPSILLHPFLLPAIYPCLFTLYVMQHQKSDEFYWKQLNRLGQQSDLGLMSFLGVDSANKSVPFKSAIEVLQHLTTMFSAHEKLNILQITFKKINEIIEYCNFSDYMWTMDQLIPLLQFVIVRAQIPNLGAEIHFIEDLMESHFELGELGIMFTTLKINNEEVL